MNSITFSCNGQQVLIHLKPHCRAKRLTLRLSPRQQGFVLTIPPRTSEAACRHFLTHCLPWMEKNRYKLEGGMRLIEGESVCLYGEKFLCVRDPLRRKPVLCFETQTLRLPTRLVRHNLYACFKQRAEECLASYIIETAKQLGQSVEAISFRDMRSRWGSCSRQKTITLNWRLILAPREVAQYVCIHEVAHLLHMNHSTAFWKVVEGVCPSYRVHKKWLKINGYSLMGI